MSTINVNGREFDLQALHEAMKGGHDEFIENGPIAAAEDILSPLDLVHALDGAMLMVQQLIERIWELELKLADLQQDEAPKEAVE